jgi:Uma2 family endonuclease
MDAVRVVLGYRDYAALPADGRRYEVHDGELSVTPAPSPKHQMIIANLFRTLDAHVRARSLGAVLFAPLDVILSDTSIVQPDVLYLAGDRLPAISSRGVEGPPTMVVEILSASTATIDRHTKMQLYSRHRVPHYWLLDPDGRVAEAYALTEEGYVLRARAAGGEPFTAEPFADLVLLLDSLWA